MCPGIPPTAYYPIFGICFAAGFKTGFHQCTAVNAGGGKLVNPKGAILAISSLAGDRGRKSNYVYGSLKGGASAVGAGHGP